MSLHPLALAGWVGIFVTAINLLPAGQLDGGHVFRALLGDKTHYLSYGIAFFLVVVGIFFYFGWLVFAFLVIFLGLRHPPPLNDISPLGWRRGLVGVAVAAILVSGFTLVPVAAQTGQLGHGTLTAVEIAPPPGYAIAGNLSVPITNQDLAPHGLVFAAQVTAAWANQTTPLNRSPLHSWAATSHWTFDLGGTTYTVSDSANATVPGGGGFYTLNASEQLPVTILYYNSQPAYAVTIVLTISEVCQPPGSGPVSFDFNLAPP